MAYANDIPADNVYWFDASRQTTRISANVSGAFGTTRISLNDNLLNRTSPEEIQAVMGHEMGHYVLNHGTKLAINFGLVFAFGFAFIAWGFDRARKRWGDGWDVRATGDSAGMPLFAALLSVYFFITAPITNGIIRVHEAEADNYGINVSGQPDGFARSAMRLSEYRKISPGPLERFVFYDHPSGRDRVHMSMLWKSQHQPMAAPGEGHDKLLGLRTVIYDVPDIEEATAWYSGVLGYGPYFDEPYYVGFEVGGFELGLLPDGGGTPVRSSGNAYWGVADVDAVWARLIEMGAKPISEIEDVGDGIFVASVEDPWGNVISLIENPYFDLTLVR